MTEAERAIRNATLLDDRVVDIAIAGNSICAVEPAGGMSAPEVLDAAGGLCVRPLTDAHLHLDKAGTVGGSSRAPASIGEAIKQMSQIKAAAKSHPEQL